jgi:hypothetical protein
MYQGTTLICHNPYLSKSRLLEIDVKTRGKKIYFSGEVGEVGERLEDNIPPEQRRPADSGDVAASRYRFAQEEDEDEDISTPQ